MAPNPEHFPLDLSDPIEDIKLVMEQRNLTVKDLAPYDRSTVKPSCPPFVDADAAAPHTARRSAARASERVESSVGSGEFESLMINGISVQPSTTASQPSSFICPMTR